MPQVFSSHMQHSMSPVNPASNPLVCACSVNTCAFVEEAKAESLEAIMAARWGCYSSAASDVYAVPTRHLVLIICLGCLYYPQFPK
jgi:hypothetical protein